MTATAELIKPDTTTDFSWITNVKRGLKLLVEQYGLAPDLAARHASTIGQTLCAVVDDPSLLHGTPQPNQTWDWAPFLESPGLTIGAVTVREHQSIPLHDHPGSIGLLMVLRGRVRIQSFNPVGDASTNDEPSLELHQTDDRMIGEGQFSLFGAQKNNLHSLEAVGGDCILFDVMFSPYQPGLRSYYQPTSKVSTSGYLSVSRLRKSMSSLVTHA